MAHTWLSSSSPKATRWVNKAVKHHPQHRFNISDTLNVEMIEAFICQELQTDSSIPAISYIQYTCGMCVCELTEHAEAGLYLTPMRPFTPGSHR